MIIGSNKQKDAIIQQGITPRLIQLLDDPSGGDELKLEGLPFSFILESLKVIFKPSSIGGVATALNTTSNLKD